MPYAPSLSVALRVRFNVSACNRAKARAIEVNRPYLSALADAVQAFGEHFGVHAHADAKVIGHFEEATRNCGRVEFRSQALKKSVGVSVEQSGE